jgi:O-antigen/teichoic acid export membrane protein
MFVNSAFSALLASEGRWDLVSGTMVLVAVLRAFATVVVVRWPAPLVWLAALMVLDAAAQLLLLAVCSRAIAPAVRFRPVLPTRAELTALYGFGAQAFLVQTSVLVIAYTDTALIGFLLGAASVTRYSLPLQLVEYSRTLVTGVTQSLLPELSALHARRDHAAMRALYFTAARTSLTLALFINVHLVAVGPAFLRLWVGPEIAEGSTLILLCLTVAATAAALSTQVLLPYYQALDRLGVLAVLVIAEAVVNFGMSVWLARALGVWGVALATAVPALGITMLLAPARVLPLLGIGLPDMLRRVIAPAVAVGLACAAVQLAVATSLPATSFAIIGLRGALSAVAAAAVVVGTFPRDGWLPIVARISPFLARRLG